MTVQGKPSATPGAQLRLTSEPIGARMMRGYARLHLATRAISRSAVGGVMLATGILLAGCAPGGASSPSPAALSSAAPSPSSAPTASDASPSAALVVTAAPSPAGSSALAAEIAIKCGPGAPVLGSGRVRASADGVRFVVTGEVGWIFGISTDRGSGAIQLESRPVRITQLVPPGDVGVSCADPSLPGTAPVTALRIEDPDGLYRPVATSPNASGCVNGNADYGEDALGKPGDPIRLTRAAVDGIQAGDVVERGGYPVENGSVRIVRGGEVVGSVTFGSPRSGGWLLLGWTLCEGLGIRP